VSPVADTVLTVEQAEDLADRTLAVIDTESRVWAVVPTLRAHIDADRERVASDLAGLRGHAQRDGVLSSGIVGRSCPTDGRWEWCADARRYSDGLLRTAALYGVTKPEGGERRG
jgi:hypothetical protein